MISTRELVLACADAWPEQIGTTDLGRGNGRAPGREYVGQLTPERALEGAYLGSWSYTDGSAVFHVYLVDVIDTEPPGRFARWGTICGEEGQRATRITAPVGAEGPMEEGTRWCACCGWLSWPADSASGRASATCDLMGTAPHQWETPTGEVAALAALRQRLMAAYLATCYRGRPALDALRIEGNRVQRRIEALAHHQMRQDMDWVAAEERAGRSHARPSW